MFRWQDWQWEKQLIILWFWGGLEKLGFGVLLTVEKGASNFAITLCTEKAQTAVS